MSLELPGPSLSRLDSARWFTAGWFSMMEGYQRRYGDVFRIHMPFVGPVVVVNDPEAIRMLLVDKDATTAAVRRRTVPGLYETSTIVSLDGPPHMSRRRILLPAFHGDYLRGFERLIADAITAHASRWARTGSVDLLPFARAVAVDVMVRALFDPTDPATASRMGHLFARLMPTYQPTVFLPSRARSERLPGPWRRFARVRRELTELIHSEIRERRSGRRANGDVCSLLMSTGAQHRGMTEDELATELLMLGGVAANHTTAVSIAWLFDYVLHDPTTLSRLEHDPDDVELCASVVDETLRIRPTADPIPRTLTREMQIGDYRLPAGQDIIVSPHLVHRRADLYDRPMEFMPERFLGERSSSYRWLPFGAGSRRCLGAEFARLEMRVALQVLFKRWRFRPLRRSIARPRRGTLFVWNPSGGVPVSVSRRRAATRPPAPT